MHAAPKNVAEVLRRYAAGERRFERCDFEEIARFDGAVLSDAVFDDSWFSEASFRACLLRNASFVRCNVKCADFREADLTGASFREAAVEATDFAGAILERTSFEGAGYYGITLRDDMGFPHDQRQQTPPHPPASTSPPARSASEGL